MDNCVPCKKAKCQTLTTKEGNIYPLEHYETKMGLFRKIQIDIIGPYHVSFTGKETRGNRPLKIWVLRVLDLLTSGVNMVMIKEYSTKGLIMALSNHFTSYNQAKIVTSDSGTQLTKLNKKMFLKKI